MEESWYVHLMSLRLSSASTVGLFLICLSALSLVPAQAQNIPRIDIFGGYSYLRFDSAPLGFSGRTNLNGGNVSLSLPNIYHSLGLTADVSGHYGSELRVYNFLAGPQISTTRGNQRFYVHALFGKARERFEIVGVSRPGFSSYGRAFALGGGFDLNYSSRFDIRVIQADYVNNKAFGSSQNNLRLSTGLVFKFGGK